MTNYFRNHTYIKTNANKDFPCLFKYSFFNAYRQDPVYDTYYKLIALIQQKFDQICHVFGLPKQVVIDVHHYLQDFEEHSKTYNIVVSNRVIAPKSGVHYLYIQNIFDWDILVDLRQTINEIRKARLKNTEPLY